MTDNEKVAVLLKEYDTLRAESLLRSSQRFQFITISGGIGAFALFREAPFTPGQIAALIVATLVVLLIYWRLGQLMVKCSRRIAVIESRVNVLVGETLLEWENMQVMSSVFHRLYTPLRPK